MIPYPQMWNGEDLEDPQEYDLIIVGGGLAGGLLAYYLNQTQPHLNFLLLERSEVLGGNHTWSFHQHDLNIQQFEKVRSLVSKTWVSHQVKFPLFNRSIPSSYYSIRSKDFHNKITQELGGKIRFHHPVRVIHENKITLENGKTIQTHCVIDARGNYTGNAAQQGYQKFLGLDLILKGPHGLQTPTLMDVQCNQEDGFRFFYCLPWDSNSLLIEDTRYSNSPALKRETYAHEIISYAKSKHWEIQSVERVEVGVLPIPYQSPVQVSQKINLPYPVIGTGAGYFHPITGYSFSNAVQVAELISNLPQLTHSTVKKALKSYSSHLNFRSKFTCYLNRMLFIAAQPKERFKVLQKFYQLPDDLISRFYANQLTAFDCARILSGKPPIPIKGAMQCLFPKENGLEQPL